MKLKDCILLVFFMLLGGTLSIKLGRDVGWDMQNYHLYNAYAFLTNRMGFDIFPANVQTYFNPLLDLPYYFMVMHEKSPYLSCFLYGQFYAVTAFLIYKITDLFFMQKGVEKIVLIFFALLLSLTCSGMVREVGMTHNDIQPGILILTAVYIILKNLFCADSAKRTRILFLAGLLIGMAAGLKLTNMIFIVSEFLALCLLCRQYKAPVKILLYNLLGLTAGFLLTNGWWMWILYSKFGNPVFPFYNNIFHSPWVTAEKYSDMRFLPWNLKRTLFFPFYCLDIHMFNLCEAYGSRDTRFPAAYIAVIVMLISLYRRGEEVKNMLNRKYELFILLFFIISYVIWLKMFAILRYIFPLQCLGGLMIMSAIFHLKSMVPAKFDKVKLVIYVLLVSHTITTVFGTTIYVFEEERKPITKQYLTFEDLGFPDNAVVLIGDTSPSTIYVPFQNPKARYIQIPTPEHSSTNSGLEFTDYTKDIIKDLIRQNKNKVYFMYMDETGKPWDSQGGQIRALEEYLDFNKMRCSAKGDRFRGWTRPLIVCH